MKHVIYSGEHLVTGNAVADALMEYATVVVRNQTSATVVIPTLAMNGSVVDRAILIGPATQIETSDINGTDPDEEERYPVPQFPPIGGKGAPAPADAFPTLPVD